VLSWESRARAVLCLLDFSSAAAVVTGERHAQIACAEIQSLATGEPIAPAGWGIPLYMI
jgi:hypothetical protein